MKNKGYISYTTIAASLLIALSACGKPEVEIVEQDNSYALDKNVISVDIPKKMDYNPDNIVRVQSSPEVVLLANITDNVSTISNNQIPITIRLRRPLDHDLKIAFKEDREKLKEYRGEQLGYKPFPQGSLGEMIVTIPAGETTVDRAFQLTATNHFTKEPGYLTALVMTTPDQAETPAISANNSTLFLKVNISLLAPKQNTSLVRMMEEIGSEPISDVIGSSNNPSAGNAQGVFRNRWGAQWWVQEGSDTYLQANFEKNKIGGFIFVSARSYKNKHLKAMRIEVSEDGGENFVYQGKISLSSVNQYVYIKFDTPVDINAIRLSEFETFSNDPRDMYVDVSQIHIIKADKN